MSLLDFLYSEQGFSPTTVIADVGSGSGIFSRLLLERGSHVFGVEPNAEMRSAAESLLAGYPRFASIDGSAEATMLEERSVDAVTCAQAFHWFDRPACRREFGRILGTEGPVVLVWNNRLTDDPFGRDYEALLRSWGDDYTRVEHRLIGEKELGEFFRDGRFRKAIFENRLSMDLEGLRGLLRSSSYLPGPGHPDHRPMMEEAARLYRERERGGQVVLRYATECYVGRV